MINTIYQALVNVPVVVWIAAGMFLALSLLFKWVLLRLPIICSFLWWASATWGILAVGATVYILFPPARPYIFYMAILFMASLVGIMPANFVQLRRLIDIFQRFGITKETSGHTIYLRELFKDENNDNRDTNLFRDFVNDSGFCRHLESAQRHSKRYRRKYRT